jgi:hypothetical protein
MIAFKVKRLKPRVGVALLVIGGLDDIRILLPVKMNKMCWLGVNVSN